MHLFLQGVISTFTLFIIRQVLLECRLLASALAHNKDTVASIFYFLSF